MIGDELVKVPVIEFDAIAFFIADEKLGLFNINLRLFACSLGIFYVSLKKSKV